MGDRANVQFAFGLYESPCEKSVWLYSHWGGSSLAAAVVNILGTDVARERWGDGSYLTRVVVQEVLCQNADPTMSSGWGLSPYMEDNEHPVLTLDVVNSTFELNGVTGTFEELCAMPPGVVAAMAG